MPRLMKTIKVTSQGSFYTATGEDAVTLSGISGLEVAVNGDAELNCGFTCRDYAAMQSLARREGYEIEEVEAG